MTMTPLPKTWARPLQRGIGALAVTLAAGGGALALAPAMAHAAITPHATTYTFTSLNDHADPTFNQLLGINSKDVIAGYFGSGATGSPNKGYLLNKPYGQSNYVNENFPGSAQTQVTGLNNLGDSAGFYVNNTGTNRGFVEWNGVYESFTNPATPKMAGSVNQLLGVSNKGVAVGFYDDAKGNAHAYEVNQATDVFTALKAPGSSVTATGINNNGYIVGFNVKSGATSSWLRTPAGQLISFQYPGGSDTQAFGINDHNEIVGTYLDSMGVQHGFTLTDPMGPVSHWQSIDAPGGVGDTFVNGINNAGDLVGFYMPTSTTSYGFLATP
jgi:hypothetical protein